MFSEDFNNELTMDSLIQLLQFTTLADKIQWLTDNGFISGFSTDGDADAKTAELDRILINYAVSNLGVV